MALSGPSILPLLRGVLLLSGNLQGAAGGRDKDFSVKHTPAGGAVPSTHLCLLYVFGFF